MLDMSDKGGAKNQLSKAEKKAVRETFKMAGHDRAVRHKWLTVRMFAKYINKYFGIEGIIITGKNLQSTLAHDPCLKNLDLHSKTNLEGIYRHSVKDDNGAKVWCYQVRGTDDEGKPYQQIDPPTAPGERWRDRLFNPFTMKYDGWDNSDSDNESEDTMNIWSWLPHN